LQTALVSAISYSIAAKIWYDVSQVATTRLLLGWFIKEHTTYNATVERLVTLAVSLKQSELGMSDKERQKICALFYTTLIELHKDLIVILGYMDYYIHKLKKSMGSSESIDELSFLAKTLFRVTSDNFKHISGVFLEQQYETLYDHVMEHAVTYKHIVDTFCLRQIKEFA
jgi:hypothetical protein